jgi:hypothetical protein
LPHWNVKPHISWYLVLLMLLLTVISGVDYFLHARQRAHHVPPPGGPSRPDMGDVPVDSAGRQAEEGAAPASRPGGDG